MLRGCHDEEQKLRVLASSCARFARAAVVRLPDRACNQSVIATVGIGMWPSRTHTSRRLGAGLGPATAAHPPAHAGFARSSRLCAIDSNCRYLKFSKNIWLNGRRLKAGCQRPTTMLSIARSRSLSRTRTRPPRRKDGIRPSRMSVRVLRSHWLKYAATSGTTSICGGLRRIFSAASAVSLEVWVVDFILNWQKDAQKAAGAANWRLGSEA